jgi:hypothetical protein
MLEIAEEDYMYSVDQACKSDDLSFANDHSI